MVYTLTVHLTAKDDPSCIRQLRTKLIEASRIYSQDRETISWFVMQSVSDEREFTIVERYERESVSRHFVLWRRGSGHGLADGAVVAEIPSGESVLEDFRPRGLAVAGQADGSAEV